MTNMIKDSLHLKLVEGPLPLDSYDSVADDIGLAIDHPTTEKVARLLFTLEQYQYDNLTGLLKRDPFINKLQIRVNDLKSGGNDARQNFGKSFLIMVDIKGLHEINKQGHHVGDSMLRSLGYFLDTGVILPDNGMQATAGRLGGDEFAVMVSYDPDQYDFGTASQSAFSRINARICNDADFPALNIGNAVEIKEASEVIELFKGADPKSPQTAQEKAAKKIGRLGLVLTGESRHERRRR